MSRQAIRDLITRHAPAHGTCDTPIEGLQLIRVSEAVPLTPSIYPAAVCLLLSGEKRVYLGGQALCYGEGSVLCCTAPLPVEAEVPRASPRKPVLGLLLSLETPGFSETLFATEPGPGPESDAAAGGPGLVLARTDDALVDAVARLLQLLDDPGARAVLAAARLRELYFALLRGDAGGALRRSRGTSARLWRALSHLREHIHQPIGIEELAQVAGMSKAVFHRRFKALTAQSPLQYIKATRLNNAAALIAGGLPIAEAAHRVGYESPSQFSREFSRLYGMAPRQWAATGAAAGAA